MHPNLRNDPLLGQDAQQRFLPTRFNALCEAYDVMGVACRHLACPRCHLTISRALLEMEPLFVSILGAPGSGKSYYLASMIWQLRQTLGAKFSLSFQDDDPVANRILSDYEEKLFLNPKEDQLAALPKTEQEGDLYESVNFNGREAWYPRPFVFSVQPLEAHPDFPNRSAVSRALCLYDNAGEHFLPGGETAKSPSQHLALSQVLLFMFDPTQHPKFRTALKGRSADPQLSDHGWSHRQDQILLEAANRIRHYTKMAQSDKYHRPVIVVLTKYDAWRPLLGARGLDAVQAITQTAPAMSLLEVPRLSDASRVMHELLAKYAPEIVAAAEGFSQEVTYVPVSALGCAPEVNSETGVLGVRPKDIRPIWAEVPMLLAIHKAAKGLVRARHLGAAAGNVPHASPVPRALPPKSTSMRIFKDTGS